MSNYVSLNMSNTKKEEINIVAEIIGALIKAPPELVAQLLMITWAALEAASDVRILLNGGKEALIKDADDFRVSLNGLASGQLFLQDNEAQTDYPAIIQDEELDKLSIQLSYEDYLRVFLWMIPTGIRTLRTMDMIEQNLRFGLSGENTYFCFDACTDEIEITASVETGYDYRFLTQKKYSY